MKQKILILCFFSFIFGILLLNLITPDQTHSKTERRKLSSAPTFSIDSYLSKEYSNQLETYLLDQFPLRESFRTINAYSDLILFQHLETNDLYFNQHHAFKKEEAFDENQVNYAVNKFNEVYDKYLKGMNVYYSIIPEKNYFDHQNMIPKRDHSKFQTILKKNLSNFQEIDLTSLLSLDDYYYSDPHWKQERIYPIAYEFTKQMKSETFMVPFENYTFKTLEPFYGAYYGQSALPMTHDQIKIGISDEIQNATVKSLEYDGKRPVYNESLFNGMDSYDVFLSGPQAFLEIELPNAKSQKELIIFRDSFGSSITPYFIGAYKKITLIDLRYIGVQMLNDSIDFNDQDVLFLYSTSVLNHGSILK